MVKVTSAAGPVWCLRLAGTTRARYVPACNPDRVVSLERTVVSRGGEPDLAVAVQHDPGIRVKRAPRLCGRVRVDVIAAGHRISLDEPVARPGPQHAEAR